MSIVTKRGDLGQTSLPGGNRVAKSDLRVEAYGTIDELISALGFARSICEDAALRETAKRIQRELFLVGSAVAAVDPIDIPAITNEMTDALTDAVHRMEQIEGILADWSIPGEHPVSAAFDVARTVCRRAERVVLRLQNAGQKIPVNVLPYLNRLSDFLWIAGRAIEVRAGVDASLRQSTDHGKPWSRAW